MKRNTSVPTRAADMENRTGQKSAARIGIEEAGGAEQGGAGGRGYRDGRGRRTDPGGSELGRAAPRPCRARHALREGRWRSAHLRRRSTHQGQHGGPLVQSWQGHQGALRRRGCRLPRRGGLGPAASAVVAAERKPEPLRAALPGWDDYIAAATDHRAHLARKQREEKERYESEMAQFRAQKAERSAAI